MEEKKHNLYKYATFILAIALVVLIASLSYNIVQKAKLFIIGVNATSQTTSSATTIRATSTLYATTRSTTSSVSISSTSTKNTTSSSSFSTSAATSIVETTLSSTIQSTTSTLSSSIQTTTSSSTIPSQNQTGELIVIPNSNERGPRFTYVPIQTSNATTISFICEYFPVGYQNPGYINGTYGRNFSSIYSLQGQLQVSNLGQSLDVSNSTYENYSYGVTCE